jgi:hypothetical protein
VSPIDYKAFRAKLNGEHVAPPEPQQGAAPDEVSAPHEDGKSVLGSRLETVSSKAVDKLEEIMGLPLNKDDPRFAGVLRAQTSAANTALTVQAKVDETALRRQAVDRLPELLRLMEQVRAELPPPGWLWTDDGDFNEQK